MNSKEKTMRRIRRKNRVRAKVMGTAVRPRISIFRSNTQISAQLIDDEAQVTLASVSTAKQKGKTSSDRSREAGAELAKVAQEKKVATNVVFDRGGYLYAGNIKVFADAAREAGLIF